MVRWIKTDGFIVLVYCLIVTSIVLEVRPFVVPLLGSLSPKIPQPVINVTTNRESPKFARKVFIRTPPLEIADIGPRWYRADI